MYYLYVELYVKQRLICVRQSVQVSTQKSVKLLKLFKGITFYDNLIWMVGNVPSCSTLLLMLEQPNDLC